MLKEIYLMAILTFLSLILLFTLIAIMQFDKRHFKTGCICAERGAFDYVAPKEE